MKFETLTKAPELEKQKTGFLSMAQKEFQAKVTKAENLICPEHHRGATISPSITAAGNPRLRIVACCEKFQKIVSAKMN